MHIKADCTSKIRHTEGMEKESENADERLYLRVGIDELLHCFCSQLYNSLGHMLGWKVARVKWFLVTVVYDWWLKDGFGTD